MTTRVTTDWHAGVRRVGGTTPQTQMQLRQYIGDALKAQLDDHDHIIAGDLFDQFTVETSEVICVYNIFSSWIAKYGRTLVLLRGNHDYNERAGKSSSFDLLAHILQCQYPDLVVVADKVTEWKQFILIPHLANQDMFNIEIEKLKGVKGAVIVVHANIDNPHAASDHSLNLSREQIDKLTKSNLLIAGHEHQHRKLNNGRCLVLGNGAPSSIADCLGPDKKYAALVDGADYELVPTWHRDEEFAELDWRSLDDTNAKFIRVVGNATAAEAGDAVNAVARYRARSPALIVSNAVKVDGVEAFEELEAKSIEQIRAFDVLGAIMDELDEKQRDVVKGLVNA